MAKFLFGLLALAIGVVMVWKPQKFVETLGEPGWAEKVFGPSHGTTAYQALGIVIILVAFMIMTGMIEGLLLMVFKPIAG